MNSWKKYFNAFAMFFCWGVDNEKHARERNKKNDTNRLKNYERTKYTLTRNNPLAFSCMQYSIEGRVPHSP